MLTRRLLLFLNISLLISAAIEFQLINSHFQLSMAILEPCRDMHVGTAAKWERGQSLVPLAQVRQMYFDICTVIDTLCALFVLAGERTVVHTHPESSLYAYKRLYCSDFEEMPCYLISR